ncbi:hypothetical protein P175DRAFT_0434368 [Aspergillus ochraceoroseus IBT 24754]|uniref:Impact N-terminal domain-containing protein n=3 Tax=Aspergillus subgen. Nidulantes TaxID=2720870 RepID=A0A0F8X8K5_9EURO|nr:uncharacterized protein P175DRAFT_0434368 [Aspergillus ochraceoroseus IBT 24754]KKK19937.1 hypothetical protein ARAM_005470 [Aspergillus rambellii]KKK23640.1 hypothetical protein AOCH_002773 [Aspergillus ochraceoroseus]PTU21685.1 hypothetical protein P175DRAFT_0434368 [Aspergillus ochraceoroseus IBT 24754]
MAASQVQAMLRFLSQDAKVPLASAIGKVIELQKADLTTPDQISKGKLKMLQDIFKDDKLAKQVMNAAKRVSKKRAAPTGSEESQPKKKSKASPGGDATTPFAIECALGLPLSSATEGELSKIVLLTNRAPLVLAFAVSILRYTMPEQPISSRLSLAQAVVSANSRSKAVSLGLESGKPAEEEGWGEGQPVITVLGRDIKVLKRWDYNPREGQLVEGNRTHESAANPVFLDDMLGECRSGDSDLAPPLWGVDTEALRSANRSGASSKPDKPLPIFTPQSARSYLLKSFIRAPSENTKDTTALKRRSQTQVVAEKETCLGHLLHCIDLVSRSWAPTLSKDELDRRAWAWYIRVRPDVQSGVGGWGEKGPVKLSDILALKRLP